VKAGDVKEAVKVVHEEFSLSPAEQATEAQAKGQSQKSGA
jgi:hypothetical protein